MSDHKDPQRISDAADNCEVLRARLAKYEDAEGRPVVAGDQGNLIKYLREAEKTLGGKLNSGIYGKAADALESQALEIERLNREAKNDAIAYKAAIERQDDLRKELAALKALPRGVVLPEGWEESLNHALIIETERAIRERDKFLETGISTASHGGSHDTAFAAIVRQYIARLNSSPVSAGEPVYQFQFREIGECGWSACDHDWYMHCQKIPERDTRVVQVGVSAGVVDDRAALPDRYSSPDYCKALERERNYLKQLSVKADRENQMLSNEVTRLRRALTASAPNHGEQVLEEWKSGFQLHKAHKALDCGLPLPSYWAETCDGEPYVHTKLWRELPGCGSFHSSRFWPLYGVSMLAAAPSAGSHGGDV